MKILHTSDWHIGRTFHMYSTVEAAKQVIHEITNLINENSIDVVVISGDIFDHSSPKGELVQVLTDSFNQILATGAKIVAISGNHDSAQRLGFAGAFSSQSGLHLLTEVPSLANPVELSDEFGPVDFYGIPFINPPIWKHLEWMPNDAATQKDAITAAMAQINTAISKRKSPGRRTVVLSHTFVLGAEKETDDSEMAITKQPQVAGGLDSVPLNVFEGPDYVALGHIHSAMVSSSNIRYPGALLHFSFKEVGKSRGGWLVELTDAKEPKVDWLDFTIPRNIIEIKGKLADVLSNSKYEKYKDYYVQVIYTDDTRMIDPMRLLKERFPFTANVIWQAENQAVRSDETYRQRLENKSDPEIIDSFAEHVRNGKKLTTQEMEIIEDLMNDINSGQG